MERKQIDVTGDGGILKDILEEGEGELVPQKGMNIECLYTGKLLDGTVFDSTSKRNDDPFKFQIGQGTVIKGWDLGIATMKKGEKAVLTCNPENAYGEQGSPPSIPANSTLKFEVELLDFYEGNKKLPEEYSDEERFPLAEKDKQKGNDNFRATKFGKAMKCYENAIAFGDLQTPTEKSIALVESCRLNLAQSYIKLQNYDLAIQQCDNVIASNPKNVKAFYKQSICNENLGNLEEALKNIDQALALEPSNNDVKKQQINVSKKIKLQIKKDKKTWGKLFNQNLYEDKKIEEQKPENIEEQEPEIYKEETTEEKPLEETTDEKPQEETTEEKPKVDEVVKTEEPVKNDEEEVKN